MTKGSMDKSHARKPSSTPMPERPISDASGSAEPVPQEMPSSPSSAESSTQDQEQAGNEAMLIPMDDYPDGRGGMRMSPTASQPESAERAVQPGAEIGSRPAPTDMPRQ